MNYFVSWEIEVKAENPLEAAKIARAAQTRPNTRSTVFQVYGEDAQDAVRVDLTAIVEDGRA
jgi:predicted nucleotide-binding protein